MIESTETREQKKKNRAISSKGIYGMLGATSLAVILSTGNLIIGYNARKDYSEILDKYYSTHGNINQLKDIRNKGLLNPLYQDMEINDFYTINIDSLKLDRQIDSLDKELKKIETSHEFRKYQKTTSITKWFAHGINFSLVSILLGFVYFVGKAFLEESKKHKKP